SRSPGDPAKTKTSGKGCSGRTKVSCQACAKGSSARLHPEFLQQGRDIRAAVRIAVARRLATVRQGALVAVAALSAGQSAELCPVLAGQAQRPGWKSSYA